MPTRLPRITLILAGVALLNPIGLDFFRAAFLSAEQLSRNIARPIYLAGIAILAGLVLIEWTIRLCLARTARKADREDGDVSG